MFKLLDIGCGPGTIGNIGFYQTLKKKNKIYGIDFLKGNIDSIKNRFPEGNFLQADASSLPFADNYFDKIIIRHVLEHVKDLKKVLLEIKRVSKKRAIIIIAVPDQKMECLLQKILPKYLKGGFHHRRIFTEKSLTQLFKKQEFTILSCRKKKWPWFLITLILVLLSRFTSLIFMEEQSGAFKIKNNYFWCDKLYLLLNGLDKLLFFLNSFIPFETEIIAKNNKL